ncbi:MAG TPA: nitrile hydratase accessory protein [Actinophytocola sp.]|uniref:nitrile hydratase accessory protein n=1 Tax=Actinophytocola sp. TaxID=1872138 RepID=UPI002DDCF4E3|nr:nitrile hydratase accessory protein [Actinophytocola sp.]HEV2780059.1 nitrile hydratase accessory protein [Actinophytocola sp.]
MSYVHDIGGLHGFGPVPGRDDELDFHAAWEARVFAIVRSLLHNGVFTWDEFRHAIERMAPADYFASGYYERWTEALERLCVEKGLITAEQRDDIRAAMEES